MERKWIMKIDLNADMQQVFARLAKGFRAPLVESAQHDPRNVEAPVRFRDGAPQIDER